MKGLCGAVLGVFALAASLVASSGAAPSGDRCVVNGTGKSYAIDIKIGPNSPEQSGFAVGAPNGTITKLSIPDGQGGGGGSTGGSPLKITLPPNTSAGWLMATPAAVPGSSITINVTTSGPVPGSWRVVPLATDHATWFNQLICQHPKGTPIPSNNFTAKKQVTYTARGGIWRAFISVPGPGTVNFVHRTLAVKGTPSPLIKSGRVSATKAGMVTLTLKATPAGAAALKSSGAIKLNLNVQFSPTNGAPANKVMSLTLTK